MYSLAGLLLLFLALVHSLFISFGRPKQGNSLEVATGERGGSQLWWAGEAAFTRACLGRRRGVAVAVTHSRHVVELPG